MRRLYSLVAGLALATSLQAGSPDADEFEKYHRHVRIDESLQEGAGNGAGVRVGVIDTDLDVDHREFEDRVAEVIKDADYPYLAPGNHGTQVTGIIAAARDGRGMVGIAPEAGIVSTWLLDQDADVSFVGPGGSLVSWFDRMERRNVQVINASLAPLTAARCSTVRSNPSERSRTSEAAPSWRSPLATRVKSSTM